MATGKSQAAVRIWFDKKGHRRHASLQLSIKTPFYAGLNLEDMKGRDQISRSHKQRGDRGRKESGGQMERFISWTFWGVTPVLDELG